MHVYQVMYLVRLTLLVVKFGVGPQLSRDPGIDKVIYKIVLKKINYRNCYNLALCAYRP